ncbi:MAG TPA: hypothetical protein VN808_08325 [Stellaceae bacterium]|nr:hypothetical protein [Stellaceae bacterium]
MRAIVSLPVLFALALGLGCDFLIFPDAYPYSEHYRHPLPTVAGISLFWLALVLPFMCSLALGCTRRRARVAVIPLAIVAGLTLTHTIMLVKDVAADPTTHNLVPFEYLYAWITVGIPAFIGSALARAICWARDRRRTPSR